MYARQQKIININDVDPIWVLKIQSILYLLTRLGKNDKASVQNYL